MSGVVNISTAIISSFTVVLKSVIYDCRFDEELLPKSSAVYVGFDPTADSLHTGNLLAIAALIHCQSHGCQPIAIVSTTVCCLF